MTRLAVKYPTTFGLVTALLIAPFMVGAAFAYLAAGARLLSVL
jgi:hypothetical protein